MKTVSSAFLEKLKDRAKQINAYIVLPDGTTITKFYQKEFIFQNTCYQEGYIVGNNIAKNVEFEILNVNNYDMFGKTFKLYIGLYIGNDYEYLDFGSFLVDTVENVVSTNSIKIKAFDYMIKFNGEYKDENDYVTNPLTLKQYVEKFCEYYGVELGSTSFANENFVINEKPESETLTGRQILKSIGEMCGCFCEIGSDDKLYFKLVNDNTPFSLTRQYMSSLTINKETIPINNVVLKLGGGVDGENLSLPDNNSIELYGENSLIIEDNIFLNNDEKRERAIESIFNKVNGFKYVSFNIPEATNPLFLETGDKILVQDKKTNNFYESIVLSQTIKIPSVSKSSISADALTEFQEDYKFTSEDKVYGKMAQILVQKNKALIEAKVQEINDSLGTIQNTILEQTSEKFTMWFEETGLSEDVKKVEEAMKGNQEALNQIKEYIQFEGAKIILGKTTSPYKVTITNEEISFWAGDIKCAYISQNKLHINQIVVVNSFQRGYFLDEIDRNQNLNLYWIGGDV